MQVTTWTITHEFVSSEEEEIHYEKPRKEETLKFRLSDDDGEVYFKGVMRPTTSANIFSPLDEFGEDYGCTMIEVCEGGKWVQV